MERGARSEPSASPIFSAKWTARALATGSAPGSPRQTGQVCVFGGSPNDTSQPQNIFVRVASWTWISSPITGSKPPPPPMLAAASDTRPAPVERERQLESVGRVEHGVLAERRTGELQADGQAFAE